MKREIICPICEVKLRRILSKTYPDEFAHVVAGRIAAGKNNLICDDCNARLDPGEAAFAVTFGRGDGPPVGAIVGWEIGYLRIDRTLRPPGKQSGEVYEFRIAGETIARYPDEGRALADLQRTTLRPGDDAAVYLVYKTGPAEMAVRRFERMANDEDVEVAF